MREINFDKCGGPLPHVIVRTYRKYKWCGRANDKTVRRQERWQTWSRIRFAPGFAPGSDDVFPEFFLARDMWEEPPRLVVSVFVKDRDAPFARGVADFLDEKCRVGNKR